MKYNGKEYDVVIWDWLWTLYSRKEDRLFNWVKGYFEKYGSESNNYLVSYAFSPIKRSKLIEKFGVDKYFKDIVIEKSDKYTMFSNLISKYGIDKARVLVIGDNVLHEGVASKQLKIDFVPIAVWNEYVYSKLGLGSK